MTREEYGFSVGEEIERIEREREGTANHICHNIAARDETHPLSHSLPPRPMRHEPNGRHSRDPNSKREHAGFPYLATSPLLLLHDCARQCFASPTQQAAWPDLMMTGRTALSLSLSLLSREACPAATIRSRQAARHTPNPTLKKTPKLATRCFFFFGQARKLE